jgi:uncharacterized membrane protein YgdD (TMEM256/DUF423 family)
MVWVRVGAALMFVAVGLGAFGAHGLRQRLSPEMLAIFETGVRYHVYHALALFAVAWVGDKNPASLASAAGFAFTIGIIVFSGSLYVLSMSGIRWLGAITPIGGVAFLVGWVLLFLAAAR